MSACSDALDAGLIGIVFGFRPGNMVNRMNRVCAIFGIVQTSRRGVMQKVSFQRLRRLDKV